LPKPFQSGKLGREIWPAARRRISIFVATRGGYAMIYSAPESHKQLGGSRSQFKRPLFATMAAAAILALAGFNLTTRAYAQEQDVASCEDKCSKDEKQCIYNQSSEELCDYDYKMCKKACNEKK
jgi:hypothetical protein